MTPASPWKWAAPGESACNANFQSKEWWKKPCVLTVRYLDDDRAASLPGRTIDWQLLERLHLPSASRSLGNHAIALVLPRVRGNDSVVRQHSNSQLSCLARTMPPLQEADSGALFAGGTRDRRCVRSVRRRAGTNGARA